VHVLLLGLTLLTFTTILQVRRVNELAAAGFAMTVLLGLHTFTNLLGEAFPINHFLEILLFSLVVLRLAQARPRLANDIAAALLLLLGALVIESGLLVWVVAVAAYLSGYRGISRRGLVLMTSVVVAYLGLRLLFSNGVPVLDERSTGYMFGVLDGRELVARFGEHPLPLYAYNVIASIATVLLSEPRAGQLVISAQARAGEMSPWAIVAAVTSLVTTVLIGVACVDRWRSRAMRADADRLLLVCGIVILANAALSFAYTKNDIVSVAGAFYALAAYAAVRRLLDRAPQAGTVARVVLCCALAMAAAGWAVRTMGLHYSLRYHAFKVRNDWAPEPAAQYVATPAARVVTERLRHDALEKRAVAPRFYPRWQERWFEE
jgi:hypothetical protein